eukprot:Em0010g1022a
MKVTGGCAEEKATMHRMPRLLANIFGAIGNYLYCAACIVSALGVWEKRLAGLHKVMTRGPEDQRTRGPGGPEDQGTRGQRTRGPGDQRTRGPEDQRTRGPEDQRTRGPGTRGPEDQGPEDQRTRDNFRVVILLQAYVHTGEKVAQVTTQAPTFTVAWHPTKHLLAYACDDKDKHDRDTGGIWLYGLANSNA